MSLAELLTKNSTELNESLKDIDSLLYQYPYFAHAQILKAKSGYHTNNILFADNLSKAALLISDRTRLFEFIFEEEYFVKSPSTLTSYKTEPTETSDEIPITKNETNPNQSDKSRNQRVKSAIIKKTEENESIQNNETIITYASNVNTQNDSYNSVLKNNKAKEEIIEKFIKTNPSVNKPGEADYSETEEQAKKSLEENLDFVSETLAEIYLKQGNKDKAIKIFQQLMLKIPEKKLYFAAQIKNIE